MNELSPRGRTLVAAARSDDPKASDRARVRAALAARLGAAAFAPPPAPAPAPVASAGAALGAGKAAITGALAVAFAVAIGSRYAPAPAPAPSAALTAPAPIAASVPAPSFAAPPEVSASAVVAPAPVDLPRVAKDRAPPPAASARATPSRANSLTDETEGLRRAQEALNAADANAAIAQLDDLARRHPDGLLREERLAARVLALCAAGRADEARREAERLLAEVPGSIQAARVRASCAFAKEKNGGAR
jgi:hypothetical protein